MLSKHELDRRAAEAGVTPTLPAWEIIVRWASKRREAEMTRVIQEAVDMCRQGLSRLPASELPGEPEELAQFCNLDGVTLDTAFWLRAEESRIGIAEGMAKEGAR